VANTLLCGNAERFALGWCRGLHSGNLGRCCHLPCRILVRGSACAIAPLDHQFEPFSGCGLCNGGGCHHGHSRGSGHRSLGAMELYAIDANATCPGHRDSSTIPVDPIAIVDDLVCPAPTCVMCNVEITSAPPDDSVRDFRSSARADRRRAGRRHLQASMDARCGGRRRITAGAAVPSSAAAGARGRHWRGTPRWRGPARRWAWPGNWRRSAGARRAR
jgi:hypothetical protein